MAQDSHPLGGRRTKALHIGEYGAGGVATWLVLSFLPDGWIDGDQTWAVIYLGSLLGSVGLKWLHEKKGLALPLLGKSGLVVVLASLSAGCGVHIGTTTPHEIKGKLGETIVAYETKGVSLAIGDGGIGQVTEGGHVSQAFASLFGNTVGAGLNFVAAFLGRGPVAQPVEVPPHDHPPAIVAPAAPPASSASSSAGGPAVEVPDWYSDSVAAP